MSVNYFIWLRARDYYLEESDYDLLIVSKKFKGKNVLKRMEELCKLLDEPLEVDLIPLTPEEFEKRKKDINIVSQAVKEGVKIKI
ncbi:MAG: nucleotidyltransferase domain-containing protein [Nanoarchaeota archaeon]